MPQSVTRTIYINAEGKGVNTIRGLNAELEKARNAFKNAEIGSEKFIAAQKELEKVKKIHADYSASLRPIQSGHSQLASGLSKFAAFAGIAFSVEAVINYGREVLKVANTQEQFTIALNTMVGSKAKADQVIAQGIELATRSPFTITQVQEGTKQLLAMGFGADEVIDKLEILGNIGAGVGVDKLPQLTLALGQVRAAGHLMGQDLNQFVQAGVPLLEEISKVMGKPTAEIIKMKESGQIGYPIVEKALRNLTTEGGRFAGLMEKQAQSLGGLWSTFGDNFTQKVTLPIGQALSNVLKPAISGLNKILGESTDKYDKLIQSVQQTQTAFNTEIGILKTGNFTKKERSALIGEINEKYKDYLPNLLTEKATLTEIEKAQKAANNAISQKILLLSFEKDNTALIEKHTKSIQAATEAEKERARIQGVISGEIKDRYAEENAQYAEALKGKQILAGIFRDQGMKAINEDAPKEAEALKKTYDGLAEILGTSMEKIKKKYGAQSNESSLNTIADPEKAKQRAAHIIDALKGFNDQVKALNADLQQTEEAGYERDILKVREKYQKQFDALTEFKAKYPEAVSKANAIESELTDLQGKSIQAIISNQFKDLETELEKHNAEQLAQLQSKEDKEIAAINQKYEKQLKILVTLEKDTVNATEAQRTDAHKKRLEYESLREQEVNNLKTRLRAEQAAKDADETAKFWEEMKRLKDDFDQAMAEKPVSFKDPNAPDEVLLNIQSQVDAEKAIITKKYDDLIEAEKGYDDRITALRAKKAQLITAVEKKETVDVAKVKFDFQQKQIQAENELKLTRLSAISDGIGAIMQFTKQNSALQKALFIFQKGVAISELIIKGAIERATISATYAANPAAALPLLLSSKIRTGINIATVAATGIAEFVTPQKYTGGFHNVTGASDGQRYKAQYVGAPNTGMLNYPSPVLLNSGVLANERGPEYFVSNSDLRNPAVFNYVQAIDNITQSRTPQPALSADRYQTGGFAPNAANSTAPQGNNEEVTMMMIAVIQDLTATLKGGLIARFEDVWGTIKDIKEYTDRYKQISGEA